MSTRVVLVLPSITSYTTFLSGLSTRAQSTDVGIYLAAGPDIHGNHQRLTEPVAGNLELPSIREGRKLGALTATLALRRFISDVNPAVVHTHFAAAAVIAAAARYLLPARHTKWLATFHGLSATVDQRIAPGGVARWELWAAQRFDRVYVHNVEDARFLRHRYANMDVRLNATTLGCDLDTFRPGRFQSADRDRIRTQLGIPAGSPIVVFIGRQVSFKGFDTAVRTFWRVRERIPACRLLLVGDRDPVHRVGLQHDEIQRLDADPTVINCGWQSDVSGYLAISDVCLFPSEREGMPVCLMEALSMGVPCVTADARGCRDIVRHGADGYVIAGGSIEAFAHAVCEILEKDAIKQSMSRVAVQDRQRFDRTAALDEQVRQYLDASMPARTTSVMSGA